MMEKKERNILWKYVYKLVIYINLDIIIFGVSVDCEGWDLQKKRIEIYVKEIKLLMVIENN